MHRQIFDVVVVGGGILGTATARELLKRHPSLRLALVEKEESFAAHQSGHNSGVIHCGIYYQPGTLKAKLCVEGSRLAYEYCSERSIPYKKCGKLIVAVKREELPNLRALYERGERNGVRGLSIVDPGEIGRIQPGCAGLEAIWSPETGIVDWARVTKSLGEECRDMSASVYFGFNVEGLTEVENGGSTSNVVVQSKNTSLQSKYVITCAGLYSDKIAVLTGCSSLPKIVPIRGEYLQLNNGPYGIQTNIYPVPDPKLPFLGVHFTPRVDGVVLLGPNAVPALCREGYSAKSVDVVELWDMVSYPGFWRLFLKNVSYGMRQLYESSSLAATVQSLRAYVPELRVEDVSRGPTGVRAQALDNGGQLVDDFIFDCGSGSRLSEKVLHVRNAPSPAATSSLAIAKVIAATAEEKFKLNSLSR